MMASSKWMMPMLSPSSSLIDEDAGIMSEAETSSTAGGLVRRNSRQRSSLPVVRTPSKTLERPLGLVFLQYRNETKRGLLPNEITTLDTVRALFVRSFANQLSMEYFDSHNARIYIHDPAQDVFYELEDLRDVRDRCILRLHEVDEMKAPYDPAGHSSPVPDPTLANSGTGRLLAPTYPANNGSWNDLSYFSEPEFDSGYRHQHIHTKPAAATQQRSRFTLQRSTTMAEQSASPPRYERPSFSLGDTSRNYSMDVPDEDGVTDGIGVERRLSASQPIPMPASAGGRPSLAHSAPGHFTAAPGSSYNLPTPKIYTTPSSPSPYSRSVFDMEYPPAVPMAHPSMYRNGSLSSSASNDSSVDKQTRIRMEQVERQLASLTGLVQTALTSATDKSSALSPPPSATPQQTAHRSGDATPTGSPSANEKLATETSTHLLTVTDPRSRKTMKEKCVSFEKSVSFCDDPIDLNEGKHTPQPTVTSFVSNVETYTQLRLMQKTARELRAEIRQLRRLSVVQSSAVADAVKETILVVKKTFLNHADIITASMSGTGGSGAGNDQSFIESSIRSIRQEEDDYNKDVQALDKDISELETMVENLRSLVINKKTRVSMAEVEKLAVLLSQSSKTIDSLNTRYPPLEESVRSILTYQMERLVEEKRFLTEEPSRMEAMMRRCKKLTSTLVTLRRLASVQEQRKPDVVQEKSMVPKNSSYTTPAPIPVNEPLPAPSTGAQGEREDGAKPAAGLARSSPERQQAADSPPDSVVSGPAADPAASAARAGSDYAASGQLKECPPPGPAPSSSPVRIEGIDNPIDLLLDELKKIDIQVARPPANQPIRTSITSLNFTECHTVAGPSLRRRRSSPPPPPPARTSSSLRHSNSSLYHATKFGSEPVNVYPPGKETAYYCYAHQPQCNYHNPNHAYFYYPTAPNSSLNRHFTSETAIHQYQDEEPPCPVHPHRYRERARTQENPVESSKRHSALETRHQELLLTRRRLQERYAQVQQWNSRSVPMGVNGLRHGATGTKSQSSDSSDMSQSLSQHSQPQSSPPAPNCGFSDDKPKQQESIKVTEVKTDVKTKMEDEEDKLSESSLISHLLNSSAIETDIL